MKKVYAIAVLVNSGSAKIYDGGESAVLLGTADSRVQSLDDRLISYNFSRGYYAPSEAAIEIKEHSVRVFLTNSSLSAVSADVNDAASFDTVEDAEHTIEALLLMDSSLIVELVTLYR